MNADLTLINTTYGYGTTTCMIMKQHTKVSFVTVETRVCITIRDLSTQ